MVVVVVVAVVVVVVAGPFPEPFPGPFTVLTTMVDDTEDVDDGCCVCVCGCTDVRGGDGGCEEDGDDEKDDDVGADVDWAECCDIPDASVPELWQCCKRFTTPS